MMAVTGYSRGWIYELVCGYNHLGPESQGRSAWQKYRLGPSAQ